MPPLFQSRFLSGSWSSPYNRSNLVFFLVLVLSSQTIIEERPYATVLSCWTSPEEADTESSNEDEDTGVKSAPSGPEGPVEGDPVSTPSMSTNRYIVLQKLLSLL